MKTSPSQKSPSIAKPAYKVSINSATDTHALIWWFTDRPKISAKAAEIFERCEKGESVLFVPSIVIAEALSIFDLKEDRIHIHVTCEDGEAKFWLEPIIGCAPWIIFKKIE